jgi:hypothetical protein
MSRFLHLQSRSSRNPDKNEGKTSTPRRRGDGWSQRKAESLRWQQIRRCAFVRGTTGWQGTRQLPVNLTSELARQDSHWSALPAPFAPVISAAPRAPRHWALLPAWASPLSFSSHGFALMSTPHRYEAA